MSSRFGPAVTVDVAAWVLVRVAGRGLPRDVSWARADVRRPVLTFEWG